MRRSKLEIVRDILEAARDGQIKTHIINATNINSQLFNIHTKPLIEGGFLETSDNIFRTTQSGQELAQQITSIFSDLSLEPNRAVPAASELPKGEVVS